MKIIGPTRFLGALVFAAACSGGGGKTGGTIGGGGGDTGNGNGNGNGGGGDVVVDANLEFRKGFQNPGGMWMPSQMTLPGHAELFTKMGVQIAPSTLADPLAAPLAAVVSLGGCTASFVSGDGLVVTNHHCVQGALQHNSSKDDNLVENGFLAKTRADERSAGPSQRIWVATAFKDVTREMRDGLDKVADPIKRKEEADKRLKTLIAACEKDRAGMRCHVHKFFRGDMYVLSENLEIRDVRLVYVPHRAIGNYGGEIDNWAWPRHTGDFSFYRAYVGKDGKPADFSPDNVPFKPKHWLKVSSAGLKPGDFVMVTGYPGYTERTATAAEVHHEVEWYYPYSIAHFKQRYAIAEELVKEKGKDGKPTDTAIKAGVAKQGIQNGLEKYQGVLAGLTEGDRLARKDALDAKIKAWAAQPGRELIKAQIEKYEQIHADEVKTARVDYDRRSAFGGSKLLGTAFMFVRLAEERTKKDADRKPGYQERDMLKIVSSQKGFARGYDRKLDREFFKLALTRAAQLPDADRPWLATILGVKAGTKVDAAVIDKALDRLYATTKLETDKCVAQRDEFAKAKDKEKQDDCVKLRLQLTEKATPAQLKASKDPFIKLAVALWPMVKAQEKIDDARSGELYLVAHAYPAAMREVLGGLLAPDANSTLRITYGTVKSFKPASKDEADWPFTTAAQILKKDTGTDPFDMPAAALEAIKAKKYGPYADASLGGELAVDFLSDLDITGGNSGSPTLNDKGELVGLAFDGTITGVSSDVVFDGAKTRTISVDARYMLWTMDAIDGADHLLEEMGIKPAL
jgi:V8-like Glu-specific endopeptidase